MGEVPTSNPSTVSARRHENEAQQSQGLVGFFKNAFNRLLNTQQKPPPGGLTVDNAAAIQSHKDKEIKDKETYEFELYPDPAEYGVKNTDVKNFFIRIKVNDEWMSFRLPREVIEDLTTEEFDCRATKKDGTFRMEVGARSLTLHAFHYVGEVIFKLNEEGIPIIPSSFVEYYKKGVTPSPD